jgi:hypothetical protein
MRPIIKLIQMIDKAVQNDTIISEPKVRSMLLAKQIIFCKELFDLVEWERRFLFPTS